MPDEPVDHSSFSFFFDYGCGLLMVYHGLFYGFPFSVSLDFLYRFHLSVSCMFILSSVSYQFLTFTDYPGADNQLEISERDV